MAFVGPTGAGKTTIFRLLLGLEQPDSGSVTFDGIELAQLDVASVRRQLGVVMQGFKLLPGNIYENIVGGLELKHDDAWEAAKAAGIADEIMAMPMRMYTPISEMARTISEGQKQRILIARALVSKPKIVLFDEATSSLDNHTQAIVSQSLEHLKVTRVVIAHRLSTIENADRIYVVDDGRIVESGDRHALLKEDGLFASLTRRQMV